MSVSNTDLYRFFPAPLAHFPDRSARWLFIDPENVRGLVELVAGHIATLLDFRQLTALNRDFLSDTLREQEADLVFSVPFQDASANQELLIHILIEHQSGVDKEMWFRFLGYMYNLWVAERQRWTAEVENMFQSMAEATFQQGIEQGETRAKQMALLKLLHHRFQGVPEAIVTQIHALHSPAHLDTPFEKALNAENLEDIDWQTSDA